MVTFAVDAAASSKAVGEADKPRERNRLDFLSSQE